MLPPRLDPAAPPAGELVHEVRQIAVLRANALGDLVFALPALESLRAAYPTARLTLLARPWHADLLTNRPGSLTGLPLVDDVVPVPPSEGVAEPGPGQREDPEQLAGFFAEQRARSYDLALQLHGGGRYSNPFVRRLGARVTAGTRTPDAEALDRCLPYVYYQSEVMRQLEVVSLVGAPPALLAPVLAVTAADRAAAEQALSALVPRDRRPLLGPLVVLHPGASDVRRRWPAARFAAVASRLADGGATVVVTGGPSEAALAESVVAGAVEQSPSTRTAVLSAAGRLSLPALVGVLERAAVVVSNDTGPLHLAGAVGTRTVGIYWAGNLINAGPPTRLRHRPHLSWRTHCPVCGWDITRPAEELESAADRAPERTEPGGAPSDCPHDVSFVDRVTVEAVLADARELLESADRGGRTSEVA